MILNIENITVIVWNNKPTELKLCSMLTWCKLTNKWNMEAYFKNAIMFFNLNIITLIAGCIKYWYGTYSIFYHNYLAFILL